MESNELDGAVINPINYRKYLIGSVTIIVVLTIAYGWVLLKNFNAPDNVGVFGDMFGALTALFSGLAFAVVVISLWMQSKELQHALLEYKKMAQAQDRSQKALNAQLQSMEKSSRINAMDAYLKVLASTTAASEKNTAKKVIMKEAEAIFKLDDYSDLTTPNLMIEKEEYRITFNSFQGLTIKLYNHGADMQVIDIDNNYQKPDINRRTITKSTYSLIKLNYKVESLPIEDKITLKYESTSSKKTYKQKIIVKLSTDDKAVVGKLSLEPQEIYRI